MTAPHRILRLVAAPAALSLLALAGCGSDDDAADPTTAGDVAPATDASGATESSAESSAVTPPTDADADPTSGDTVTIARSRFDPTELVVAAGTTVTFDNTDPFDHTVTSRDDSSLAFDSGAFGADADFTVTFDEPGTYPYFCEIHPTMRASIVVE